MILDQFLTSKRSSKTSTQSDEQLTRSIMKSVSWRIIGTVDTIAISWLITGTLKFALSIGFVELITKMVLYIVHERLWNKISWGKKS
jgi:uncharacterized membrane protein